MSPASLPVKLRQARGAMTLGEAARRSGVSEPRIRMYEEGERAPYSKTLRKLAQAYGIPAANLAESADREPRRRAAPRVRRRRRRIRGSGEAGFPPALEVPVEVTEGQSVRLVIELIIRPGNRDRAEPNASGTAVSFGGATAGDGGRASPSGPDAAAGRGGAPTTGSAAGSGKGSVLGGPALTRPSRTGPEAPRGRPDTGNAPGADGDAQDPVAGFRRAYTEFRREKK